MPVVVSVLFFLMYYIITLTGEKLVRESLTTPFRGMWFSSIFLLIAGIFLTYKATTDSVILNTDTYIMFFKNLFKKKNPRLNENSSTV